MSLLGKKDLHYFDNAILYVTTCSDVDVSFKKSRRFLECKVAAEIPSLDGEDERYQLRCAQRLRRNKLKNGMFPFEAQASRYSPFLMTEEFFNELKSGPEMRKQWLKEVEELILGTTIPEGHEYWHNEVNMIIDELGITPEEAIADIYEDFTPDKMEIIRLEKYF